MRYAEFCNAICANVFNLCLHFHNPVKQHIVRFEVLRTLVMKLEVLREMMSYCWVTTYWLTELAAFLFRVVQKSTFSWFTPADLQKKRARIFSWLGDWLIPSVSLSDFEKIKSCKKIYSGTSLKMGRAKSIKTPVTNYKSTWSPRHRTLVFGLWHICLTQSTQCVRIPCN